MSFVGCSCRAGRLPALLQTAANEWVGSSRPVASIRMKPEIHITGTDVNYYFARTTVGRAVCPPYIKYKSCSIIHYQRWAARLAALHK